MQGLRFGEHSPAIIVSREKANKQPRIRIKIMIR
jgi:hypothetical protein